MNWFKNLDEFGQMIVICWLATAAYYGVCITIVVSAVYFAFKVFIQ